MISMFRKIVRLTLIGIATIVVVAVIFIVTRKDCRVVRQWPSPEYTLLSNFSADGKHLGQTDIFQGHVWGGSVTLLFVNKAGAAVLVHYPDYSEGYARRYCLSFVQNQPN